MRRRSLLAAAALAGAAGCLGALDEDDPGGPSDDPRYERCEREAVTYRELPEEIRAEVDAALENGYEADRIHLADAIDVADGYVIVDGTYYDASVTKTDGGRRLALEAAETPELSPRSFDLENRTDGRWTGTVTVETYDGEELLEREVDVEPDESAGIGSISRVGVHSVIADPDDGEPAKGSLSVTITDFGGHVVISDDGIDVIQAVADLAPCPWNG